LTATGTSGGSLRGEKESVGRDKNFTTTRTLPCPYLCRTTLIHRTSGLALTKISPLNKGMRGMGRRRGKEREGEKRGKERNGENVSSLRRRMN